MLLTCSLLELSFKSSKVKQLQLGQAVTPPQTPHLAVYRQNTPKPHKATSLEHSAPLVLTLLKGTVTLSVMGALRSASADPLLI